jgi:hypothetical protein
MVTQLVVIGDSFCHGVGTASPFRDAQNTHWSFGRYLADYYELEYVNLAQPGISIARTVELAVDYLEHNTDSMVVAGWTHPRRIGLYSDHSMLQILPSYALLGDSADTDVWVQEESGVKFVTNRDNSQHLDTLAQLHRITVNNDFFEGAANTGKIAVKMFRTWCADQDIQLIDFNVFPNYNLLTTPAHDINFGSVMPTLDRHPTREEQQKFAELWISKYGKK